MDRRFLLSLAAVTLAAALAFPGRSSADAFSDIQARGTIRIAVPQDFPPFGSVSADMTPVGYDVDMANLIAQKLGVKLDLVPVTSDNRIAYLQTNKVDLVISSLGKNAAREKVIDFSSAYAPFFNGVFAPASVAISKPGDLSGKTIGVTRGAVEDLQLTKVAPPSAVIKRYGDNDGTISAFLSGQVDAIATGNVVAAAILKRDPPRRPELKFLMQNSPCYVGLNKNEPALLGKVNAIIAGAKTDGALDAISMKWLGAKLPANL